jgi:hypothetical protein
MARLEIFDREGRREVVELGGAAVTLGRSAEHSDLVIKDDPLISRLHAVVAPLGPFRWTIEDKASKNGTWVNGQQVYGAHALQHGAEIRLGATAIVFCQPDTDDGSTTQKKGKAPEVTPREREVLLELCRRPLTAKSLVRPPGSVKEVAAALFVGEAAVKAHLGNLYDKFGIPEGAGNRRELLAAAAIDQGIVRRGDYEDPADA